MHTLIVYCHPNHKSYCHAMLQSVKSGLDKKKASYDVIDLYEEMFDPVLIYNEDERRRDMHKHPALEKYRELIKKADKLVFIYPIFWSRPPAMLLGFIDRLFGSNFAYRDNGSWFPEKLLKGKQAVCISSMKGPNHYIRLLYNNAHQNLMKKALFDFVGIGPVKFFEFGNIETKGPHTEKYLQKLESYFSR